MVSFWIECVCLCVACTMHVHNANTLVKWIMIETATGCTMGKLTWNVHKNASLKFKTNNQTCIEHLMNAAHLELLRRHTTARNGSCTRNILFKSANHLHIHTFMLHCIALLEFRLELDGRTGGWCASQLNCFILIVQFYAGAHSPSIGLYNRFSRVTAVYDAWKNDTQ